MTSLVVRIKKKSNGEAALTCERGDGSVTWQRQEGPLSRFFPLHDLTHFAVESVLGFDSAFFGSISNGWDISDFAAPGAKDRLTEQAMLAEMIVGFFDVEQRTGFLGDADEYAWKIQTYREEHKMPPTTFVVTDEQLLAIRAKRGELFAAWQIVPPGETLELRFQ
ncbi:MAG TPA: hypothetical protein VGM82_22815 [Gemmatimonadaceae bacterium]|jgi:hypothetical protein